LQLCANGTCASGLRALPHPLAGRYGGEEFVLLLAETSPEAALDVLVRMRARWSSIRTDATFSTGIAAITNAGTGGALNALTAADEALYASKAAGRGSQDDRRAFHRLGRESRERKCDLADADERLRAGD
jgi:diguanylate cyclase (GGDEF)-like protein